MPLEEEYSHNMDRITQLQDGIEQLLQIMSHSVHYLVNRTDFKQVTADIPITKSRNVEKVDTPEVFEANKRELVADLVRKAKQVEYLIQSLPEPEKEEDQARRYEQLENDIRVANEDYRVAVVRAKALHKQVTETLRIMLGDSQ